MVVLQGNLTTYVILRRSDKASEQCEQLGERCSSGQQQSMTGNRKQNNNRHVTWGENIPLVT